MKTGILALVGIAVIATISIAAFSMLLNDEEIINTDSINENNDFYYPEYLTLQWTDEKIIEESDLIVVGDYIEGDSGVFYVKVMLILKGDTLQQTIPVYAMFSEWYLEDGTLITPEPNNAYIWFLTHDSNNSNQYKLAAKNGIVNTDYLESIQDAIAKPTILNSITGYMIDLTKYEVPLTQNDNINYHKLIQIVSKPIFVDLFEEIGVIIDEDDVVLTRGPWILAYTEYSNTCGYVVNDDTVYWLESDMVQNNLTKAVIMSENPDPCRPGHFSCFCSAQYLATEDTLQELVYFNEIEEAYVGNLFQQYLAGHRVANMPSEFVVGNLNLEMKPSETTFCGAFVNERINNIHPDMIIRDGVTAHRYFSGVIKNDQVISFGLEQPMNLCAINEYAKAYPYEYVEAE